MKDLVAGWASTSRGRAAILQGNLVRAEEAFREAEEAARKSGNPRAIGMSLLGRSSLALARDQDPSPFAYEALAVFAEADDLVGASEALELVGALNAGAGAHEQAARLLAAASALRARAGACRYPVLERFEESILLHP